MSWSRKKDIQYLKERNESHKGEWLTIEVATEYLKRALELPNTNGQFVGERRKLCLELMEKYDITQVEGINILNGFYHSDYDYKCHRIQNQVLLNFAKEKKDNKEDDNEDK